jgi:hypothetical protein
MKKATLSIGILLATSLATIVRAVLGSDISTLLKITSAI